jgi:hypothetical protein
LNRQAVSKNGTRFIFRPTELKKALRSEFSRQIGRNGREQRLSAKLPRRVMRELCSVFVNCKVKQARWVGLCSTSVAEGEGIEGAGPVELRDCNMKNLFSTELLKIFIAHRAAVTPGGVPRQKSSNFNNDLLVSEKSHSAARWAML